MTQEILGLTNIGAKAYSEFIDFYEYDNHLDLYKSRVKTLNGFKNRCRGMNEEMINQKLKINKFLISPTYDEDEH